MTSRRFFYALCAILILMLSLIAGVSVGGNYLLQKQSDRLTKLKVESKAVDTQQTALLQAKKDIERYKDKDLDEISKSVVPQDKDQAKTVREIVKIADESKVPIKSISFDASTLGSNQATSSNNTGTSSGDTKSTQVKQANPSQLKPVTGIKGVYVFELQVTSANPVTYQQLLTFLEKLERNRRTSHVTSIGLNPDDSRTKLDFSLKINAYVKP